MIRKIEKAIGLTLIRLGSLRPRWSTKFAIFWYGRWGMNLLGRPNYISATAWFDGADYSLISISEGCTISSETSFLTHDWSVYNIGRALRDANVKVVARNRAIKLESYCFIGRGAILMPGATIGEGAVVGAGSVVRGIVEPFTIVMGNPAVKVADAKKYYKKELRNL